MPKFRITVADTLITDKLESERTQCRESRKDGQDHLRWSEKGRKEDYDANVTGREKRNPTTLLRKMLSELNTNKKKLATIALICITSENTNYVTLKAVLNFILFFFSEDP